MSGQVLCISTQQPEIFAVSKQNLRDCVKCMSFTILRYQLLPINWCAPDIHHQSGKNLRWGLLTSKMVIPLIEKVLTKNRKEWKKRRAKQEMNPKSAPQTINLAALLDWSNERDKVQAHDQ